MNAGREQGQDSKEETVLCGWCGCPLSDRLAISRGYHDWCVEQIIDQQKREDVR